MARIEAFRAFRYNPHKVGSLSDVLCPPYDVFREEEKKELLQRSPYNAVRLEQPNRTPADYQRVAATFAEWSLNGVLIPDDYPTFTVVEERFKARGSDRVRRSFRAAVELAPWGKGIYPHENTRPHDRRDRDQLLETALFNSSPILAIMVDPKGSIQRALDKICKSEPATTASFNGVEYVTHIVQPETLSPEFNLEINRNLIVIADGHHRYESALEYSQRGKTLIPDGASHVMMDIVPLGSPGWVIEPTHRLIHADSQQDYERLLATINYSHHLTRLESLDPQAWEESLSAEKGQGIFVLTLQEEGSVRGYMAEPKNPEQFAATLRERFHGHNDLYCGLDVVTAAYFIEREGVTWGPERDPNQVAEMVRQNRLSLGILVRPPKVSQVFELAVSGERAPQKTTFFLPKAPAGIAFRSLIVS